MMFKIWCVVTFYQRCHGSQVIKLVFARPSGLNGVGEEVRLVSWGYKTMWSMSGWSGWGKELRALIVCKVAKC
jgi:hypothetical protein